ncbi:MAG: NAD+ synthase [Chlamydiota bacterium]|nr:NAD+ synthase [Chlamydiota bacterium]
MKIFLAQINPIIGDLAGNTQKIVSAIDRARSEGAQVILFPEMTITGYPPEDFLVMPHFIEAVEESLHTIISASTGIATVVGLPRKNPELSGEFLCNSAAIIDDGVLLGFQDKALLPSYDVFSERRYFAPTEQFHVWELYGKKVVVTICEDIWQHSDLITQTRYPYDPIEGIQSLNPDIVLNLSASPFNLEKCEERISVCKKAAATLNCPVVLCNQVGGNDSLIFDGHSVYAGSDGQVLGLARGFVEDFLMIDTEHRNTLREFDVNSLKNLYDALVLGVRDYFHKSGFTSACLGLSGGIDSAVVACLAVEALGSDHVLGVSMPSRYSSEGSVSDAKALSKNLGIDLWSIPIEKPFSAYLETLEPFFKDYPKDVTEENIQARARGMIMMAISNKLGHVVLATGNKSEMAMGYATLYGDMCGGLGVISDLTKKQVYALANWINREKEVIPVSTITKPPSAELRLNQKDSDSLPDYEVIDNIVSAYVEKHLSVLEIVKRYGYDRELVEELVRKIHRNEYKRRQSAPGLRVSAKSFTTGRRFPIVQGWK